VARIVGAHQGTHDAGFWDRRVRGCRPEAPSGQHSRRPRDGKCRCPGTAANTICFALLWKHRTFDINFRSTWLCSRNDLAANSAVIMAASFVDQLQIVRPDVLVGVAIVGLFLSTAFGVLHVAMTELRRARSRTGDTPLENA
jgi:hypothetical protein